VAALMLAKEPSLFNKAVLLDPVGATGVKFDPSMIAAFEQMKTDKNLVAVVLGATIYENDSQSDFFRQIVVEDAFHCVNAIGHNIIKALDNFDARAELAQVPNEILVLHGEHDTLLSMDASKKLAEILPKGEFRVIAGHGHCLNAEDPAQFVSITRNFLFHSA
jgi:pimeloyl-ACP methyl ester carboxylesterase